MLSGWGTGDGKFCIYLSSNEEIMSTAYKIDWLIMSTAYKIDWLIMVVVYIQVQWII